MTEQETIERIIEAVPEIMELKQPEFSNYIGLCVKVFGRNKKGNINFPEYGSQAEDIFNKMKTGRDITLEDCLIAIGEIKRSEIWECRLRGNIISIAIIGMGENDFSGWFDWQLNKPFHEQSDYTKDFIGNLLK